MNSSILRSNKQNGEIYTIAVDLGLGAARLLAETASRHWQTQVGLVNLTAASGHRQARSKVPACSRRYSFVVVYGARQTQLSVLLCPRECM